MRSTRGAAATVLAAVLSRAWDRRLPSAASPRCSARDKGSPEAIQDAMTGRSAFYMAPINTVIGQMKDGKLAALGVSTAKRSDVMPDVPPIAEQGLAGFDISLWFGVWAPAGTPPAIVSKVNAQIATILASPEVREQFAKLGITPSPMKPDEFARFVRGQIETYRGIVKRADIQPL